MSPVRARSPQAAALRNARRIAALACAGAATLLAAQPAAVGASDTLARGASPWDGAWVLDTARSGPEARDGAADGYVFRLGPDGRIRWEIPSLGEVVTGRTDGRPMPVRRPGAPPGLTLAVRREGPTVLRYAVARNGTSLGEGRMTLVEDGRAWVDLTWPAGRPEHARVVVYARRPRDHAAAPSVRERLAAQNRLFQRWSAPDTAAAADESPLAAAARQHAADSAYRAELLAIELLRAVQLVVDPGIHAFGWGRDSAVAYLRSSGAASEPLLQAEVDRDIAWPAQGLSYKVGQLKFLELRERARRWLGARFDARAFHHAVLAGGPLPLPLLDAAVDRWVDRQLQTAAAAR